jgi:formate-dependent nitrite reductase cytochrome c552 subunit
MCITLLALSLPVSAYAVELDEAAKQAARQNNAKVLSARTVKQNNGRTHEIKLLTNKGVVKTVRVPDNSKKKKKH